MDRQTSPLRLTPGYYGKVEKSRCALKRVPMGGMPYSKHRGLKHMKLTIIAVSMTALLAGPAMAGGPSDYGKPIAPPAPTTINRGGTGGSANQNQQQGQKQSLSSNIQNRISNRTSSTTGPATATTGSSDASIGSISFGGGGSSDNGGGTFLSLPSNTASGLDCPTVGAGIGGTGNRGSGLFSYSTLSTLCNQRMVTHLLSDLYGKAVARSYAEKNIDGVKEAVAAASQGSHTGPKPVRDDAWCNAVDARHQALMGRDLLDYAERCRG